MAEIQTKADQLRQTIKENVRGLENPTGILTKGEKEYLDCLEVDKEKLKELFEHDEAHWTENLELIQR